MKNPPVIAGDMGLISGLGRSPEEANGKLLQYSCLGNPIVHGVERVRHNLVPEQQHPTPKCFAFHNIQNAMLS